MHRLPRLPGLPRLTGTVGIACALALAACTGTEADALARARERLATADAATARAELQKLVQAHPKSGDVRLLAGLRLLADGDAAAAAAELERALEFGASPTRTVPPLAEALLQSGQASRLLDRHATAVLAEPLAQARLLASVAEAWLQADKLQTARATVERAEAQAPDAPQVKLARARVSAQDNDVPGALARVKAALAAEPGLVDGWMLQGDLLARTPEGRPEALQAYDEAIRLRPDLTAPRLATMAVRVAQGDLAGAQVQLAELRRRVPDNLNTVMAEGQLAFVGGDHVRAREVFQALLRVLPDNLPLLLTAGENEMLLGSVQQAEAHFAKASALAPRNPTARRLLARAQLRLGQVPRALATLEPLVNAPDASAEVLALAAEASRLNGDARQSQALYDRLAVLKPAEPALRTLLAVAALGRGDDSGALQALRDIAASDAGTAADLALVDALLARNQHEAALKAIDGLQRKLPDSAMPLRLRGQLLASQGRWAPARQAFDAALALAPDDAANVAALAAIDLREGQAVRARDRLTALVRAQPKDVTALLALADVLERQGAPAASVRQHIDAAIKAAPGDLAARVALVQHHLHHGDDESARHAALAADAALPDNLDLLDLLGRCQARMGQRSQALANFGRITTLAPRSPRGFLGLAEVQLADRQFDQAQRSLQRALELSPGLVGGRILAVRIAAERGDAARALELARQLQTDQPARAAGFVLEGELHMAQGRWPGAVAALRKALERSEPGAASALLYRALVQDGRSAEAEQFASQRQSAHPGDVDLLLARADAARQRGDLTAAQQQYERALALQPEHVPALNNLALVLLARQQPGALALAEKAAGLAAQQAAVLDTLAQAQAREATRADAIATQRRAVNLSPDTPDLRLALARLLLDNNERADARQELQRLSAMGTRYARHQDVADLLRNAAPALPGR